jgi:rRNA maturation endonuclease Nob1
MEFMYFIWRFGAVFAVVLYFMLMAFLWHGYHLFRETRRRMAEAQICSKCGREVLVAGAKFCGRCGGQLVKAA